jgi:hypothetical protein
VCVPAAGAQLLRGRKGWGVSALSTGWSVLTSPEATTAASTVAKAAASAIAGEATKKLWRSVSTSAESKALVEPIALALVRSIEESRMPSQADDVPDGTDWWSRSGQRLLAPFTDPDVAEWLVAASLQSPGDRAVAQGALLAALDGAGHCFIDLAAELGVDPEQFLHVLPGTIADEVFGAALQVNSPLRDMAQSAISLWSRRRGY